MAGANQLPCMNCQAPVKDTEAKLFAEVFVCPDCYDLAVRVYAKSDAELQRLRLLLRESIRVALVQGNLRLPEQRSLDEVPKEELLKQIVQLTEKADARRARR